MNGSREYARVLLRKAREDVDICARLIQEPPLSAWGIGFHAQQAVEKLIKAVLCLHDVIYPRTHNIVMLLELLRSKGISLPPDAQSLAQLTPFGIAFRYEDLDSNVSAEFDGRAVIVWAQNTMA